MEKLRPKKTKIEEKVVETYQSIESSVVGNYQKIEDKFVKRFLEPDSDNTESKRR